MSGKRHHVSGRAWKIPQAYAQTRRLAPNHGAVPQFPDEQVFVDGTVAPVAVVHPASTLPPKPNLPYTAAPDTPLAAVHAGMTIQLSASPDSGWPTLRGFLGDVSSELTVGIYDFTSSHVLETVRAATIGKTLQLVIDHPAKNPTADQTDEATVAALRQDLGAGLTQAWALTRMDKLADAWIYPSAYHIKVAVKDHQSMWLSSGNWNNSNQPAIDPVTVAGDAQAARHGDRDWHVVIDHPGLAAMFEAYLSHDLTIAAGPNAPALSPGHRCSHPTRHPPDSAVRAVLPGHHHYRRHDDHPAADPRPRRLRHRHPAAYCQRYHHPVPAIPIHRTPHDTHRGFSAVQQLIGAVADRQQAGVDVKIIMSEFETAGYLEQLQNVGIDVVHNVKLQNNVHNKGIIVDGHTVLVSSQNWSVAGTLHNRDAGVIIANSDAAGYFQQIFLHDWENLTTQTAAED